LIAFISLALTNCSDDAASDDDTSDDVVADLSGDATVDESADPDVAADQVQNDPVEWDQDPDERTDDTVEETVEDSVEDFGDSDESDIAEGDTADGDATDIADSDTTDGDSADSDLADADAEPEVFVPPVWILDPEFQTLDTWTLSGGVEIQNEAAAERDDGLLAFERTDLCAGARASQEYTIGSYDEVGPIEALIVFREPNIGAICKSGPCYAPIAPALLFGHNFQPLPAPAENDVWYTNAVCLGQGAYGGTIDLSIGSAVPGYDCGDFEAHTDIDVSHLDLRLADGTCPVPGELLDGDFESGTLDHWSTEGTVTIAVHGDDSSAVLTSGANCENATIRQSISVPLGLNSGVRISTTGLTTDSTVWLGPDFTGSGNFPLSTLQVPSGADESENLYCLPLWARGSVVDLVIETSSTEEGCADSLTVDDIELVEERACSGALVPGGDFESAQNETLWVNTTSSAHVQPGSFDFVTEEDNTAIELALPGGFCSIVSVVNSSLTIPDSSFDTVNALLVAYDYFGTEAEDVSASAVIELGTGQIERHITIRDSGTEQTGIVCLPEGYQGFPAQVELIVEGNGSCGSVPPVRAVFDNIQFGYHGSCAL